ncbi:hypothetical protein [Paludibacterium paludis]|uniref:hypothetical protein n=1 Tax=Paludibacterium paludis TaxID=1225769 RepID=UPI001C0535FE|nr:hypothetical protein [Paludibacterium paludis]
MRLAGLLEDVEKEDGHDGNRAEQQRQQGMADGAGQQDVTEAASVTLLKSLLPENDGHGLNDLNDLFLKIGGIFSFVLILCVFCLCC